METPTLTLAHGRSALSAAFRDIVGRTRDGEDDVTCAPWLADSRRRALLAHIGVGTIDQALLAVLPTKFATLRHFALSSKILIVDEVHEMGEPYMQEELMQLLRAHAMRGGSAILAHRDPAAGPAPEADRTLSRAAPGARRRKTAIRPIRRSALPVARQRRQFPQTISPKGPVSVRRLESAEAAVEHPGN